MHRLFITPLCNVGSNVTPNIDICRNLIKSRVDYQQEFYKIHGQYVPSNHILIRLAYLLSPYIESEVDLQRRIYDNVHEICTALQLTSSTTKGRIFNKAFYTNKCIILSTTFPDTLHVEKWNDLRPVRCLTHPFTSMEVRLPPITAASLIEGITAVGIDIYLYAKMLLNWIKENEARLSADQESISQFISKYVLTGMINEQVDISVRNRLPMLATGIEIPVNLDDRQFVLSYSNTMDSLLHKTIKKINSRQLQFIYQLEQLPLVYSHTYLDAVPRYIGEISPYCYWATCYIFVDWIYSYIDILNLSNGSTSNVRRILRTVDRFLFSGGSFNVMPVVLRESFMYKYKKILQKYLI